MTPENFAAIAAEGYNHIPVTRELLADLDTPLSCYVKVANGPYSYLLESAAQGGEKWSRYSMVGLPAKKILKVFGHEIVLEEDGVEVDRFEARILWSMWNSSSSSIDTHRLRVCLFIPVDWLAISAMTVCATLRSDWQTVPRQM